MIHMAEFIVASRANKILRNARLGDVSYTNLGKSESGFYREAVSFLETLGEEESIGLQKRLSDIIYLIYPGATCNRFFGVEDTQKGRFHYPITVAHIIDDEKEAYIPFYIGNSLIFAMSTFKSIDALDRIGDNFFFPICRVSDIDTRILTNDLEAFIFEPTETGESLRDKFKNIVDKLVVESNDVCKAIINTFPTFKYGFESEIISCKDTSYRNWHNKMGLESEDVIVNESRGLILSPDDVIREMDFLPIVLSRYYKCDNYDDKENGGYSYTVMSVFKDITAVDERPATRRVCIKNSEGCINEDGSKPVDELLILRDSGSLYPLFELEEGMYFYGQGRIVFCLNGEIIDSLDIDDIYETRKGFTSIHEHYATTEEGVGYLEGTESVGEVLSSIKIAGIRAGTGLYNTISKITKLPVSVAKTIWNSIRRVLFIKQNEASKEMTDELREKALNDELDILTGKLGKWLESGVLGLAAFALAQSIIFGFALWYIFHKMASGVRARAMEPLEHQVNTNIQVIDMKIRFAESEGDTKKIEELMRYRGHLLLMRHKALRYKKEVSGEDKMEYNGGKISEVDRTGGGY